MWEGAYANFANYREFSFHSRKFAQFASNDFSSVFICVHPWFKFFNRQLTPKQEKTNE